MCSSISQSSLTDFVTVIKPLSISKSKAIDSQLLKMICKEYHPFSLVEDPEFRKLISLLSPGYSLPSRKTLTNSLLPQTVDKLSEELKSKLNAAIGIALTTDGWTSMNNQSFIAITAHYCNEESQLCSNLLGCFEYSERHTSANLADMLKSQCAKWGISDKIVAVVTDNAFNMVAAVKLCNWSHIPCYAHSLNLTVTSSTEPISDIIEKCKSIVQYFKRSSHALAKLHEAQRQMKLPELKLIQDVPTRWNSMHEMLKRLHLNKAPIISTLAILEHETNKLSSDEWVVLEHAIDIFGVFNDVTKEISAEKNVTLPKTMVLSRNLFDYVQEYAKKPNLPAVVVRICTLLTTNITERLISKETDSTPESSFLDPRFKKISFKNSLKFDAVNERLLSKVTYEINKEKVLSESSLSSQREVTKKTSSEIWTKFDNDASILKADRNPRAAAIVEVDKFLSEPLLDRECDPLTWWEQRKNVYPHLFKIVLKKLCIPASSVPCERVFSKAGQIMTEKRNRLTTTKLSNILFINSNF